MELRIGSIIICNTSGILNVQGKQQIILEWGEWSGQLLLTMNLYNAGGKHTARLRRNEWTFNDNGQFEFGSNPRGLKLIDTRTSQVALLILGQCAGEGSPDGYSPPHRPIKRARALDSPSAVSMIPAAYSS
jgi:hypothetical protein